MLRHIRPSVGLSVRPSIRYTSVFCQNDGTQKDAVFTIGCVSSIPMPRIVDGGQPCPGKISVERGRPPAKTAELYIHTFRLIAPEP